LIKTGSEYIWIWVAIEGPESKSILGFSISKEQNILIAERFVSKSVEIYGHIPFQHRWRHLVSAAGL
jgi:putative transposase